MLLGEPPATQADIHFRLFGFPVRVHPFFWIVALILGMGGIGGGDADPTQTLIWVVVVFVSILVHELGHAFMQRRYGGHPWITLYAMGGLAACNDCDRSPRSQVTISAAGPAAGFLLALATLGALRLTGHQAGLLLPGGTIDLDQLQIYQAHRLPLLVVDAYWQPLHNHFSNVIVQDLLAINILWGVLNLLPIYPLDGGHISRELLTLGSNPRAGIVRSLWLSVSTAAIVALFGLMRGSIFMALMFGYLAYLNYRSIQAYEGYGTGHGG